MTPEQANEWRVVPRLLMLIFMYLLVETSHWFMTLAEPTTQQSAFISTIWGALAGVFGMYCATGGKKGTD